MTPPRYRRWLFVLGLALVASSANADVSVPAKLQAQLVAKVASFDRNFLARAGNNALILVVQKPSDSSSAQLAQQVSAALRDLGDVGGAAKTVEVIPFAGAAALAATCTSRKVALVYLSAGLESDAGAIAAALAGVDVLTIGASGSHAEKGAIIGFDLEGGKPKIVINVATAKAQHVAIKAELLKLARVIGR
jgi:hypothetical protein